MAVGVGLGLNLRTDTSRRDQSAPLRHVDGLLLFAVLVAAASGVLMIYSATRGVDGSPNTSFLERQLLFVAVGSVGMAAIALFDYRRLRAWSGAIYGGALFLLLAVLSPLGSESKGAQAWFSFGGFQLQPSEFAKVGVIVFTARLLARWRDEISLERVGIVLAVVGAPMLLILAQNDLGTVLVFCAITMGLLLVGGVRGRHLALLVVLAFLVAGAVLNSDVLKEYQRERLTSFIDPSADEGGQTFTFNVQQAQKAIANGGFTGQGLFEGPQTQLAFVPEQQTDFIFTVPAEELGFVGAAALLALYGLLVWRIWRVAQLARDQFGTLLCVGVLCMVVFQMFQNIGMAMGIMPVTGLPLPFLSYGGSSTIASFLALGVVQSVHMHRFR